MGICHVCKNEETTSQIKAGCGHLVYICDECREETNQVRHSKCVVCKGGKTPDQTEAEEKAYWDNFWMRETYYYDDDFYNDDFEDIIDSYEEPLPFDDYDDYYYDS